MRKLLALFKRKRVTDQVDSYNQMAVQKLNKRLGL
jgi:hypothetical protein